MSISSVSYLVIFQYAVVETKFDHNLWEYNIESSRTRIRRTSQGDNNVHTIIEWWPIYIIFSQRINNHHCHQHPHYSGYFRFHIGMKNQYIWNSKIREMAQLKKRENIVVLIKPDFQNGW